MTYLGDVCYFLFNWRLPRVNIYEMSVLLNLSPNEQKVHILNLSEFVYKWFEVFLIMQKNVKEDMIKCPNLQPVVSCGTWWTRPTSL